jgi:sarcosine oxidase subunit beta
MTEIYTDALVIGGGVMGASTLYALSSRGIDCALLERNSQPGMETSARSGAIVRAHYGVPELVKLSLEANKRFLNIDQELGYTCGFTKCGYFVMVDEGDVDTLKANIAMHRDFGVNVSLVPADSIAGLAPCIKTEDAALAAYEPDAGFADPSKTVNAFISRSRINGAKFIYGQTAILATRRGNTWTISLSNGDTVYAEQVVLTAGNWSNPVGALFGLDLPVKPVRAQIVVLERPGPMRGTFPVVSDLINLAYFRIEGDGGLWVGSSDMADLQETLAVPDGFDEVGDAASIAAARRKTALRFASMPEATTGVVRAFAGLYETTPDWQPIIDSFAGNLHVATGFSGHGFKLSPVVGDIMADCVTGTGIRDDAKIFTLSRFAEGKSIKSLHAYQRAKFLR